MHRTPLYHQPEGAAQRPKKWPALQCPPADGKLGFLPPGGHEFGRPGLAHTIFHNAADVPQTLAVICLEFFLEFLDWIAHVMNNGDTCDGWYLAS